MQEGLLHNHEHEDKQKIKYKSEFMNWLEANSSFFWTQFLALLGFLAAILEVIVHFSEIFKEEKANEITHNARIAVFVIQSLFILIVIFFLNGKSFGEEIDISRYKKYFKILLGKDLHETQERATKKITELNLNIFARYWLLFWKWIFLLYMVLSLKDLLNIHNQSTIYFISANVIETFLNNFSMVNLFLCFLIIQDPINSLNYNQLNLDKQFNRFLHNKMTIYTVTIGVSVLHLLSLLGYFLINDFPTTVPGSGHIKDTVENINLLFNTFSGIFNCFALALLVARLDSKIINVPSRLISILIVYAAIQPLFIFFDSDKHNFIVLIVSTSTLIFKIYFYLIVAYIINTGRLTDLFFTFPLIKKLIEEDGYEKKQAPSTNAEDIKAFNNHLDLMILILRTSGYSSFRYKRKLEALSEIKTGKPRGKSDTI